MSISKSLENADTDVKIDGVKAAVERFIDDPTQSLYARVYIEKCVEVYESIIADYERDVDSLLDQINNMKSY